ncbi:hypothetical protein B0H11DRAFT_1854697 [Mycena galericulata]|nr:hypothetical protein B0H11DRAFT_1854697 [Mycena galericulata]
MDPITATTTLITLATFIKDLIEVGQSIKESIEKVSENRRRIRELTNDVLRSLVDLANLTRGHEDAYQAPALLGALGDLKADMLYVLETCRKISPVERSPGFRGIRSQIKAWRKRDEVEREIRRLKEHVINCIMKFTAFSTARNEQRTARIEDISLDHVNTTLRVEQTVVVSHTENQVRLRRLEGMVAQVLLETPFGQKIADRTMEIILSDPTHKTVESQYLSEQTKRLVQSLEHLMNGGHIIVDSNDVVEYFSDPGPPIFVQPGDLPHVVHRVLGMVLQIQNNYTGVQMESLQYLMQGLGAHLIDVGMMSEAIAWEVLVIQILEHFAGCGQFAIILPQLAHSRHRLSGYYQRQLQYELALQASQQALDILQSLSPEHLQHCSDPHWECLSTTILVTHSMNLQETGQQEIAVTIAQKAIAACHSLVEQTIESASQISPIAPEVEYNAVISTVASFILAKSLDSVDQHIEAYEASKEGFQLVLRFSGSIRPPAGEYIDSFIDHICKVAEDNTFSLTMLADNMVLFRDLACHYLEEFSSQFLRLLYAYVYISGQDSPPTSMKELRIFLEPDSNSPPPVLHTSSNESITYLDDFNAYGGVLKDVLQASYVRPWNTWNIHIPLIKKIFITHFDQATAVIQEVISRLIADTSSQARGNLIWMLHDLLDDVLPFIPHPNQVVLSNIGLEIIGHLRQTPSTLKTGWYSLPAVLLRSSRGFQLAGLLDEALAAVDEAIELCRSSFDSDNVDDVDELRWSHVCRAFILCDMARVSDAMEAAREANTLFLLPSEETDIRRKYLCIFQTRILRHTARNHEAIQVLEIFMSSKDSITDGTFNFELQFLLTELAAIRGEVGYLGKAVHDAEQVVMVCRKEVRNTDAENQKGTLVHSLTTLSNCLAAVGRHEEALVVAEEATSIYNSNAPHMWGNLLYTIRKQELGGNAFHSLSLRLATSGQLAEALAHAEKSTELYRELVSLAPVHLPSLAKSIRNQAAILWKIGGQDESIAACEEAVNILRNVADNETYFLAALGEGLDELAGYLMEKGEVDRASAVTAESAEVQKRIEALPPQPPFLFVEVNTERLEDADEDDDEGWETATESDDEYHDVLDAEFVMKIEGEVQAVTAEDGQSQHACADLQLIASTGPPFEAIVAATNMDVTAPRVSPPREHEAAIISILGKVRHLEELKLSSTPMSGILWWIWLAILSVAVAVLWSRV